MRPSAVNPTPKCKHPPLAVISKSVLITFCADLYDALGTHPQSLLSGMQLSL